MVYSFVRKYFKTTWNRGTIGSSEPFPPYYYMHAYYNPPIQTPAKWTRANALDKASPSLTRADPAARSTEWLTE